MGWKTKSQYIVCEFCGHHSEVSQYENRRCEHCQEQQEIYPSLQVHPAEGIFSTDISDGFFLTGKHKGAKHKIKAILVKRKHRTINSINEGSRNRMKYASGS